MGRKPNLTVAGMMLAVALAGCQDTRPRSTPTPTPGPRWASNPGTTNNTTVPNNPNPNPYGNINPKPTNSTAIPATGFVPASAQQSQPGGSGNSTAAMAAEASQQRITSPYTNQYSGTGSMIPDNVPQLPQYTAPGFSNTNNIPAIPPPPNTIQPNSGSPVVPLSSTPPGSGFSGPPGNQSK